MNYNYTMHCLKSDKGQDLYIVESFEMLHAVQTYSDKIGDYFNTAAMLDIFQIQFFRIGKGFRNITYLIHRFRPENQAQLL